MKYDGKSWKTDLIENAGCIWGWWRAHHASPGIYFLQVLDILALVCTSIKRFSSARLQSAEVNAPGHRRCPTQGDHQMPRNAVMQ